jgi:hypothetical protein
MDECEPSKNTSSAPRNRFKIKLAEPSMSIAVSIGAQFKLSWLNSNYNY